MKTTEALERQHKSTIGTRFIYGNKQCVIKPLGKTLQQLYINQWKNTIKVSFSPETFSK